MPSSTNGDERLQGRDAVSELREAARTLEQQPHDERAYRAASDAWVAAVDDGSISTWQGPERSQLEQLLIEQPGVDVLPPIFHHRISAQHTSAIEGHLARSANALEPLLRKMLCEDENNLNLVLMLLLLRSRLKDIDQHRITELHWKQFKRFPVEYLAIPYSVMFHRDEFGQNADDVAELVRGEGLDLGNGTWPITHLLLAYWLSPESFAAITEDWSANAIRSRISKLADEEQQLFAARSLALRFDGAAHELLACSGLYGDAQDFTAALKELAERRLAFARPTSISEQSAARIDSTPNQAASVAWNLVSARAPVLARIRRKPKVAICVSGQLRGFRSAFETWKRLLLPGIESKIFVSSWQRIGRASPEPFRYVLPFAGRAFTQAYKAAGTELGLPEMKLRYPSLYQALDQSADTSEAELSKFYDTPHVHLDDEQDPQFAALANPEKMHRKIEQAFHMAVESGEEFDLILRIRPDKPLKMLGFWWDDMVHATSNLPRLYAETAMGVHYGALEIGDQFALGGLAASQVYAETWSRAANYSQFGLRMFHRELTGHVSLAQMCWLHGIEVRRAPVKFGALQDPDPLPVRAIQEAIVRDSSARMDAIDRRLIAALEVDTGKGE